MQPSEIDVVAEYRDEQRAFFHAVRGALSATSQNGRNTFYSILAARKKIVRQDKKKRKLPTYTILQHVYITMLEYDD